MPSRPPHPCSYPGCNILTKTRFCVEHTRRYGQQLAEDKKRFDKRRGSASSRGYDHRWHKLRDYFLVRNPLCERCEKNGMIKTANVVDHIVPHRGNKELLFDINNLQSLCTHCHSSLKQREERRGGEGRVL